MGPLFNVLLSIILLNILFSFKYQAPAYVTQQFRIGYVKENSAAARAGLKVGDTVTRFDGLIAPTYETAQLRALSNPGQPLSISYRRGSQEFTTILTPDVESTSKISD